MQSPYLTMLDELLADGLARVRAEVRGRHRDYVISLQRADGGFSGRQGGSDVYYTDFALRILLLCDPASAAVAGVREYLATLTTPPQTPVEWFNRLNLTRLLHGEISAPATFTANTVYDAFLLALCDEMQGTAGRRAAFVRLALACQCADGGFANTPEGRLGQTNATAAALALLVMAGGTAETAIHAALDFLATMQAPDGGLRAHADCAGGDLLSTFTGLLSLAGLDAAPRLNLSALARFTAALAHPTGGFHACPADDAPDIEYTYYGLGTLGVLYLVARG